PAHCTRTVTRSPANAVKPSAPASPPRDASVAATASVATPSGRAGTPAGPATEPAEPAEPAVPTVRRRLATLMYEGVILFGVVFFAGYLFSTLTQQRNGLVHHNLLAGWIGLVLAAYFVWFWTHSGQTLPMKTWRMRVVRAKDGAP